MEDQMFLFGEEVEPAEGAESEGEEEKSGDEPESFLAGEEEEDEEE